MYAPDLIPRRVNARNLLVQPRAGSLKHKVATFRESLLRTVSGCMDHLLPDLSKLLRNSGLPLETIPVSEKSFQLHSRCFSGREVLHSAKRPVLSRGLRIQDVQDKKRGKDVEGEHPPGWQSFDTRNLPRLS